MKTPAIDLTRRLVRTIKASDTSDGDGVKITRVAGRHLNEVLDPFLLIDEINSDDASDYIGGFPEHPHRGFETITYMLNGRMRHRDHMGNEGVIEPGGVQWMTAGRGVLHSEMPEQEEGLLHGFQIWLNLPAVEKMKPAAYRDIPSEEVVEAKLEGGGLIRVVAGNVNLGGQTLIGPLMNESPAKPLSTEPVFIDVHLLPNEKVVLGFNAENPALVLVYTGSIEDSLSGDQLQQHQMGVFSQGEGLALHSGATGARMLVLSGKPIKEPVEQYGPFVMNNMKEINQALKDFRENGLV